MIDSIISTRLIHLLTETKGLSREEANSLLIDYASVGDVGSMRSLLAGNSADTIGQALAHAYINDRHEAIAYLSGHANLHGLGDLVVAQNTPRLRNIIYQAFIRASKRKEYSFYIPYLTHARLGDTQGALRFLQEEIIYILGTTNSFKVYKDYYRALPEKLKDSFLTSFVNTVLTDPEAIIDSQIAATIVTPDYRGYTEALEAIILDSDPYLALDIMMYHDYMTEDMIHDLSVASLEIDDLDFIEELGSYLIEKAKGSRHHFDEEVQETYEGLGLAFRN